MLLSTGRLAAQWGGDVAYSFLTLPSSAKVAAMGDAVLLPKYNDVSQLAQMPALLDSTLHKQVAVNYANYFANANYVQAAGAWHDKRYGSFALTLRELNYGSFARMNEDAGNEGTFSANEFALMMHYAQRFSPIFHVGITAKTILSQLERYTSVGIAIDVALRYQSLEGLTNIAFAVKNAGLQLKTYYTGDERQSLPFALQLSAAHKFEAAPFGISLSINNLQQWNLYKSTQPISVLQGSSAESNFTKFGKELMCHLSFGIGIYPSEKFFLMAGYNYLRNNELSVENQGFGSGFSIGAGLRIKQIELGYAWGMYHTAGGSHNISVLIRL
ncbi:hypothetical protein FACS189467_0150 [Bacteroidia bacterium]|nr:hypothetical protein FACS189467_0150 [Bacteroidia bacterium]